MKKKLTSILVLCDVFHTDIASISIPDSIKRTAAAGAVVCSFFNAYNVRISIPGYFRGKTAAEMRILRKNDVQHG